MVDGDKDQRSSRSNYKRRSVLSVLGASGMAALAGCSGNGGGNGNGNGDTGNGGGNGNGNGDTGNGGGDEGEATSSQDLTEIDIAYPPWPGLPAFNYITQQTDILENELNERGYTTGQVSRTWDEVTLFLSGNADILPTAGGAEAARMAQERELDLTVHAQAATNYMAWYVREGSELDPANTGGFTQTMQKMVDEDWVYGHAGWNQGIVWPNSAIMWDQMEISYGPTTNPPLNIRQADYATLPRLLVNEDIDMMTNGPPVGTSNLLVQDDPGVVPIKWEQVGLQEAGLSPRTLNLGGFVTATEFSENHEDAIVAWMDAWQQGVEWGRNPDNWDDILDNEDNWGALAADSREEAEINLRFSFAENPAEDPMAHTDNPLPVILEDTTLTESRIDDYMEAIEYVEMTGALEEGDWRDRLSFKALSF
jgi:hypothetical protein